MKKSFTLALSTVFLLLVQGCFRQEVQVAEYHIPDMTTPAAEAFVQSRLKGLQGIQSMSVDSSTQTLSVSYESSTLRKMNIEETIAFCGFAVNNRPANPQAKLPKGLE